MGNLINKHKVSVKLNIEEAPEMLLFNVVFIVNNIIHVKVCYRGALMLSILTIIKKQNKTSGEAMLSPSSIPKHSEKSPAWST